MFAEEPILSWKYISRPEKKTVRVKTGQTYVPYGNHGSLISLFNGHVNGNIMYNCMHNWLVVSNIFYFP
jgi:hypothetical protein